MTSFPLLRLPSVALKEVIPQLNIANVFELTMASSRFKTAVEYTKYPVDVFRIIFDNRGKKFMAIVRSKLLVLESYTLPNDLYWKTLRIDGGKVQVNCQYSRDGHIHITVPTFRIKTEKSLEMEMLDRAMKHFMSFLKVGKLEVNCSGGMGDITNFFIWNHSKSLSRFTVRSRVTPEELDFILEDVTSEYLALQVMVPREHKYSKPFKNEKVEILDATWIDFERDFLGEYCKELTMTNPQIWNSQINRVIREWISGEHEQLVMLKFDFVTNNQMTDETLLQGIEAAPTRFEFEITDVDMLVNDENCVDVKRAKDGLEAVFCHTERFVKFIVMRPRN